MRVRRSCFVCQYYERASPLTHLLAHNAHGVDLTSDIAVVEYYYALFCPIYSSLFAPIVHHGHRPSHHHHQLSTAQVDETVGEATWSCA